MLAAAESENGFLSQPVAVVIRSDVDDAAARDRLRHALETVQGGEDSDELYRALAHMHLHSRPLLFCCSLHVIGAISHRPKPR